MMPTYTHCRSTKYTNYWKPQCCAYSWWEETLSPLSLVLLSLPILPNSTKSLPPHIQVPQKIHFSGRMENVTCLTEIEREVTPLPWHIRKDAESHSNSIRKMESLRTGTLYYICSMLFSYVKGISCSPLNKKLSKCLSTFCDLLEGDT